MPAVLTVTDAFVSGDAFNVLDSSVQIGATPPVQEGAQCGSDPVPCLANPLMSHAIFGLSAGPHSIDFVPHQMIAGGGAAYFRWDPVIPEPGTWALFGTGLLALGALYRMRKA